MHRVAWPSPHSRLLALAWAGLAAAFCAGHLLAGPAPSPLVLILGPVAALPVAWSLSRLALRPQCRALPALVHSVNHLDHLDEPVRVPAADSGLKPLAEAVARAARRVQFDLRAAREGRDKFETVLNGMCEGVLVLDGETRLQSLNSSLERTLPALAARLGRRLPEALPDPELLDACEALLAGAAPDSRNLEIALDDGRVFAVNVVRPADPTPAVALVLVFHDVSELKRLEAVRRDFAANVSHELRTPLTSIKGYAETILTGSPPPDVTRRFLEVILRNADHMAKMVEDLLSLSRIEAGKEALRLGPMQARDALCRAWDAVEHLARTKDVDLDNHLSEDLPLVLGDPELVTRVFRNLLENAVKFGPEHRPVSVLVHSRNGFLEFEVRDQGPGIPKKDQPRIFERFYSVQKHRRNEYGSTGLGLAICRHTLRNMNGEIRVESPPPDAQGGTSFYFTLPRA